MYTKLLEIFKKKIYLSIEKAELERERQGTKEIFHLLVQLLNALNGKNSVQTSLVNAGLQVPPSQEVPCAS